MAYTGNLIPIMTSNAYPVGVATASTENATANAAWKGMDKSNSTFWRSTSAGKANCWLSYRFVLPSVIDSYSITASTTTNTSPKDFKFQGGNAGVWTDLDTWTAVSFSSNEKKTYTFVNTTKYQEYRILVSVNNGGTYTEIAEIEMFATISPSSKIAGVNLQTEIVGGKVNVARLNLQTEILGSKIKVAGLTLQVEWVEAPPPTSGLKYYDGADWVACPLKMYDGADWVEKPLKFHNGVDWTV